MIKYKINVINVLKSKGYTTYKIRHDNIFSQSTLTKFNNNSTNITLDTINCLCQLLDCKIEDIIEYIPDNENKEKDQSKKQG